MRYTDFDSPIGSLLLTGNDVGLTGLYLPNGRHPVTVDPEVCGADEA